MVLAKRALREALRTPEALIPTMFIPLFFLVVNVGQVGKIFPLRHAVPAGPELRGVPAAQLAAARGVVRRRALFLVEEIEGGYFDKLRAAPVSRTALVIGRLVAEAVKMVAISLAIMLLALPFGVTIQSGPVGFVLLDRPDGAVGRRLLGLHAADRAQDAQRRGDQLGRHALLPAAVPDAELRAARPAHRPMEIAATFNPVTYMMESQRSLVLDELDWSQIWQGYAVIGALGLVMVALSVRVVRNYD